MTPRFIAHMPGAAGNFLSRICEQSDRDCLFERALYPPEYWADHRRPHPTRLNWQAMERRWHQRPEPRRYDHGHPAPDSVWLRVTVTDPAEWDWAVANALWKTSSIRDQFIPASDPSAPALHHIALRSTWSWPSLASALDRIGVATNPHCETLWQSWHHTWCPTRVREQSKWRRIIRSYDPVRPDWIR